jgi:hypothetical protein
MLTLTSKMLMELAKTDKAMSWAVKHNRPDVYEEYFQIRMGVFLDFKDYKRLSDKQYANLAIY